MKMILFTSILTLSGLAASAQDKHPCLVLKKACEAAGFVKGEAKQGKGLYKNCLDVIAHGQSVPGVTVNQADVDACKAKHDIKK